MIRTYNAVGTLQNAVSYVYISSREYGSLNATTAIFSDGKWYRIYACMLLKITVQYSLVIDENSTSCNDETKEN